MVYKKVNIKNILVFVISAGFFLLISGFRFGDSGHALTLISRKGGKAIHPVHLDSKYNRFSIIVTARVLPPYRGNVRVALEGEVPISHEIYFSEPIIDLGLKKGPYFKDNILYGLEPGSRIALWLYMRDKDDRIHVDKQYQYMLAFYDTKTDTSVLKVPLYIEGKDVKQDDQIEDKNDQGAECH